MASCRFIFWGPKSEAYFQGSNHHRLKVGMLRIRKYMYFLVNAMRLGVSPPCCLLLFSGFISSVGLGAMAHVMIPMYTCHTHTRPTEVHLKDGATASPPLLLLVPRPQPWVNIRPSFCPTQVPYLHVLKLHTGTSNSRACVSIGLWSRYLTVLPIFRRVTVRGTQICIPTV